MPEKDYTRYQRKIIDNYYRNRGALALQKMQDLVTDLYLAETERKKETLWKRIEKALGHLEISDELREHILTSRSPEVLAQNLKDWWASPPAQKKKAKRAKKG